MTTKALAYQKHSLNNTRESFVSPVQLHSEVKTLALYRTKGVFTLKIQNRFNAIFTSFSNRSFRHFVIASVNIPL
jgi:hypothetical protein